MHELRWDPIQREWIIVASERKERPTLPDSFCPFCPSSSELPREEWRVVSIPNKFPSLREDATIPGSEEGGFYRRMAAKGVCEVIVYSPDHSESLAQLDLSHIEQLIDLWTRRFKELAKREYVKYVLIFENKGREIGVTLDHPHGQIYAFPFIPPRIQNELHSSRRFMKKTKQCLFCRIISEEKEASLRIVSENPSFVCFLPFFARWPYGVQIYPKRHVQSLLDFKVDEKRDFARILKDVLLRYDNLFNISFPYMMVFHQSPTDEKDYSSYHFHVEFYPPYRARNVLKFFASVEHGAGTATYDYNPEEKAEELRRVKVKAFR